MTGSELDKTVLRELSVLRPDAVTYVSRHLVMVAELLDDDAETAYRHAVAARSRAARLSVVREAVGLAAYASGRYAEALAELRTVRRLTGSNVHLPTMADCERGLGRPERALALAVSEEARQLDLDGQVEMLIVAAGARSDLGQHDAAVVTLQVPELHKNVRATWMARLRSAYSDALAAVGRTDEARDWLQRALEADVDGDAGIADRLAEQEGLYFDDLAEYAVDDEDAELPEAADDADEPADELADEPAEPETTGGTDVAAGTDGEVDAGPVVPQEVPEDADVEPAPPAAPPAPAGSATDLAFLAPEPLHVTAADDEDDQDDQDEDDAGPDDEHDLDGPDGADGSTAGGRA